MVKREKYFNDTITEIESEMEKLQNAQETTPNAKADVLLKQIKLKYVQKNKEKEGVN